MGLMGFGGSNYAAGIKSDQKAERADFNLFASSPTLADWYSKVTALPDQSMYNNIRPDDEQSFYDFLSNHAFYHIKAESTAGLT